MVIIIQRYITKRFYKSYAFKYILPMIMELFCPSIDAVSHVHNQCGPRIQNVVEHCEILPRSKNYSKDPRKSSLIIAVKYHF